MLRDSLESDDNCLVGNGGNEFDTDTSDNNSDSGDRDNEVNTCPPKASSFELATWYGQLYVNSGKWSR